MDELPIDSGRQLSAPVPKLRLQTVHVQEIVQAYEKVLARPCPRDDERRVWRPLDFVRAGKVLRSLLSASAVA